MRILIAEDEVLTRMDLRGLLEDAGFEVVGEAKDGLDAVQYAEELRPDLVLMDIRMPHIDGLAASKMILSRGFSPCIVLLTAYSDADYIKSAVRTGVYGYLVKPVDAKTLVSTLQVAYQKSLEHQSLRSELDKSKQKLEDRILIERAKGYLMQEKQISEEQAYRTLRELSQQKHCSMRFIAEAVIIRNEDHEENI